MNLHGSDRPAPAAWEAAGFEALLRRALVAAGDDPARVASFRESGYTRSLHGLRLDLPAGARIYLQVVAGRPPDQRRSPTGTPPPPQRAPVLPGRGPTRLTAVERHLVRALTQQRDERLRFVEPLSTTAGAIPFGLRVTFHNGAVVCCYLAHAVAAGVPGPLGGIYPSKPTI